MSCREFQDWLQQRLDGQDLSAPPAVAQHLTSCAECRQLDEASRRLLDGLAMTPRPEPAPLLTQSILAAVLDDRRRRRTTARRRVLFTASLAASLMLLMLSGWLRTPPGPGPGVVENPVPRPEQPEVPELAQSADDARHAVASLTGRVADQTKEQAKVFLSVANALDFAPMPGLPSLSDLEQPLDPAADSLRQATETVASGIGPIASSARRAFEFFSKEMPMFEIPHGN